MKNITINDEILKHSIKLLTKNGYIVIKPTKEQLNDAQKCENCDFEGDCSNCSCSICILN